LTLIADAIVRSMASVLLSEPTESMAEPAAPLKGTPRLTSPLLVKSPATVIVPLDCVPGMALQATQMVRELLKLPLTCKVAELFRSMLPELEELAPAVKLSPYRVRLPV